MSARGRDADKISGAVRDLRSRGVWAASAAPPMFRLFWRLGVPLPPPYVMTFTQAVLVCGAGYAAIWMLFEWVTLWGGASGTLAALLLRGGVGGVLFGRGVGAYLRHRARALNLPEWPDYVPSTWSDIA